MHIAKAGHARNFFIQARIMFHRAGAERKQARIDTVILLA